MPAPFTNAHALKIAPEGADGVTVTPSGTAFAPSAWVEITPATSTAWVVPGVYVVPADINAADVEIEVGIGAAGAEVPVAGPFICRTGSAGCTLFGHTDLLSPILFNRIPTGSRVAVRMRKSGTSTATWRVKVAYYEGPLTGSFNVTDSQLALRLPANAPAATVTTPTSAWGNSSYAVLGTLPVTAIILGVCMELNGNGPRFEIDLAVGPTGAEVAIAQAWENSGNVSEGLAWLAFKTPLGPFTAGTQLSFRARDDSTSARDVSCSILVLPHPYSTTAVETTLPLRVVPEANSLLALPSGAGVTPGNWVEVWASSPAIIVQGFVCDGASVQARDLQLGVGAAGSEVVVASQRVEGDPATQRLSGFWPTGIPIPAGTRVALRTRIQAIDAGLQYLEGTGGTDNVTPALTDTMQVAPVSVSSAIQGVAVTPGDNWAWGAWVELTAGEATTIGIYGISKDLRRTTEEAEWQIGIGAAGAEVAIATFGDYASAFNSLMRGELLMPALRVIPANTRVAVRLRTESNGAFTGTHRATLLFYAGGEDIVTNPPGGGTPPDLGMNPDPGISLCGAEIPVVYHVVQTDSGEKVYGEGDDSLGSFAIDGRVLSSGVITRPMSNHFGNVETATQAIELADVDGELRGLDESGVLIDKRVDSYITTKAGILAGATPRRVNQGHVARYKSGAERRFRLELEDWFTRLLNEDVGNGVTPQRTFGTADFPNLPDAMHGKAVPIGYGWLSDEALGASALGVVPGHHVGARTLSSGSWDEFVFWGHAAPAMLSAFIPSGGGLSTGTAEPSRTKVTTDSAADFLMPGHPAWIAEFGNVLYRDYNGNRYYSMFMRGPRAELAKAGTVPLVANLGGVEDVGDGTGNVITSGPMQLLHLLTNWIVQSYTSGGWLSIPTIGSPPYARIRGTSFDDARVASESLVTGGFVGAFMLGWEGQFHAFRDVVSDALRSFSLNAFINKDGQLAVSLLTPGAAVVRAWSDQVDDDVRRSFDSDRHFDDKYTICKYKLQRRYIQPVTEPTPAAGDHLPTSLRTPTPDWYLEPTPVTGGTGRPRTFELELPCVRDTATALAVAQRFINLHAGAPRTATHTVNLCGTDIENGDNQTLTHYDGPATNGWADRLLRVERHELNCDAKTVAFTQRDIHGM